MNLQIVFSKNAINFEDKFYNHITEGYAVFKFQETINIKFEDQFLYIDYDIELRLSTRTPNHYYTIKETTTNIKNMKEFIPMFFEEHNKLYSKLPYMIEDIIQNLAE